MHPPERRGGPPIPQEAATAANTTQSYRNRRLGAVRLPQLPCGCPDPWPCRCREGQPSDQRVEGYAAAIRHLGDLGLTAAPFLPELRQLWRAGEHRLVDQLARTWELVP